jgi:ABC-type spermidine/putrescine transport system permease subunit II
VTPKVNAISTLLLVFTVLLTFIALRLQARAEAEKTS